MTDKQLRGLRNRAALVQSRAADVLSARAVQPHRCWDDDPADCYGVSLVKESVRRLYDALNDALTPLSERVRLARQLADQVPERRGNPAWRIVARVPQLNGGMKTRDYIAMRAGFGSVWAYRFAARVLDHGCPELVRAMDEGKVSLRLAARLAGMPHREQMEALAEHV